MMPDCLPALSIRETPLTGSFIEECIGRVDLGGAVEGGRYGSVHGPSGMGFDLRSADRHRSYDGKTVGYGRLAKMAMAMAMALLRRGGDGCR